MQHDPPTCGQLVRHPSAHTAAAASVFSVHHWRPWLTMLVLTLASLALLASRAHAQVTVPSQRLAAGWVNSLFIRDDGSLWDWGVNYSGSMNEVIISRRPVQIGAGYTAVAAGRYRHTLALKADGSLWGWGSNEYGELGNGSYTRNSPLVQIGTGYTAMVAGSHHSLALKTDGSLWTWGRNEYGQLGVDSPNSLPVQIGTGYTTVAAGDFHSLALKTDGSLWAWGNNYFGQVGDGTFTGRSPPVQIGTGYTAVAAGAYHTLALKADGSLWAWGSNESGELGDGTTISRRSPVQIGTGYTALAAGGSHSLALKADGSLWAWGLNDYGQLGDGTTTSSSSPVQIGTGYIAMAAGVYHSLALKADGSLWAWGDNNAGQLGDGGSVNSTTPVLVNFDATANVSLRVLKAGMGSGSVTSSPAGINCGFTCMASFAAGTPVTLTAQAAPGSFVGWSGMCSGTGSCTVSMDSARSVTAVFDYVTPTYRLVTLSVTGTGTGSVSSSPSGLSCAEGCTSASASFVSTSAITLTAQPATGSTFVGWSGACTGTASCTIAAGTSSANVTASFNTTPAQNYTLTVSRQGTGSGAVTSNPAGINCGSTCSANFTAGTTVTLSAQPALGSTFSSWSGACIGTSSCTVSMSTARSVTANFTTIGGGGPLPDPVVFVTQQYRDFLGREPDAQGLQSWVNALRAGTLTRAQVIQSFMYSQEFQGRFAPLVRLYGAYFLRLPDYKGLMDWFNAMYPTGATGLTLAQVSENFAQSPEFTDRYGFLNNTQFVTLLYRNVLKREPDSGGLAHWVGLLDNPDPKVRMSRGQVMIGFSESIEYQNATSNSVLVIMSYVGMLRRAPEQSGYDSWLAAVNAGRLTVLDLINGFLNSQEYANRF